MRRTILYVLLSLGVFSCHPTEYLSRPWTADFFNCVDKCGNGPACCQQCAEWWAQWCRRYYGGDVIDTDSRCSYVINECHEEHSHD